MMRKATKDARARAEQIATQGGRQTRSCAARAWRRADQPALLQLDQLGRDNDTAAIDKTITATIGATFALN